MNTRKKRIGSSFDDFLSEENILEETEAVAIKRVIAYQIENAMKKNRLTKTMLAKKMNTSRSSIERLFNPENKSVTLMTLNKAAAALGKKLEVQLV
jgi:predicted XRE-type DNA-binding protein